VRPSFAATNQAGQATDLAQLIRAILAPYTQESADRLHLEGEPVSIGANTTTSLALVLHELATNAAKYGCLSTADGRLAIRWAVRDSAIHLTWTEAGGPNLQEAPNLEGFGSQLARKSITGQLGGTLAYDWRGEGLVVSMTLALDRLVH
jgi:two-component sensor histidine kinase